MSGNISSKRLESECGRLATFLAWEDTDSSALLVAKSGFHYTGKSIKCHNCGLELQKFMPSFTGDPLQLHSEKSPTCSFVRKNKDDCHMLEPSKQDEEIVDHWLRQQYSKTKVQLDERIATFRNLKHKPNYKFSQEKINQLAKAGFLLCHRGNEDFARCHSCQVELDLRRFATHNPWALHIWTNPDCLYVKRFQLTFFIKKVKEKKDLDLPIGNELPEAGPGSLDVGQEPEKVISLEESVAGNLDYRFESDRLKSFCDWNPKSPIKPEDLAKSGFFYTGKDEVNCFFCNGALRNWQTIDDAWFEHARWFPHCGFVRLSKGENFITHVQEKYNPPSIQPSPVMNEVKEDYVCNAAEETVARHLKHSISEVVVNMGFDIEKVKQAIINRIQILGPGDYFPNIESLLDTIDEEEKTMPNSSGGPGTCSNDGTCACSNGRNVVCTSSEEASKTNENDGGATIATQEIQAQRPSNEGNLITNGEAEPLEDIIFYQ